MITVGKLAKRHGISRSTLLYYHRIGLLCPTGFQSGQYRQYTGKDERRLQDILHLRSAGMGLSEIAQILDDSQQGIDTVLLRHRLLATAARMEALRVQQRLTAKLLGMRIQAKKQAKDSAQFTRETWSAMMRDAGFSEEDMRRWHREFEESAPGEHQRFLANLGLVPAEIRRIRAWSAQEDDE